MNCVAVRQRLAEHALGGLGPHDAGTVEGHLQWCAACRKEARELQQASAALVFSIAPANPPPDLGDRVVKVVLDAAGRRAPGGRGGRIALALVVAAALALSGLGWGAVMAGRASRFQDQADAVRLQQVSALREFGGGLIKDADFTDPRNKVLLGPLSPAAGITGAGTAMTLVSPSIVDMAVVIVAGLTPGPRDRLPYTVTLSGAGRRVLTVGRISSLDTGGGATISKQFNLDLAGFTHIVVRDAAGQQVLSGDVSTSSILSTPSP